MLAGRVKDGRAAGILSCVTKFILSSVSRERALNKTLPRGRVATVVDTPAGVGPTTQPYLAAHEHGLSSLARGNRDLPSSPRRLIFPRYEAPAATRRSIGIYGVPLMGSGGGDGNWIGRSLGLVRLTGR